MENNFEDVRELTQMWDKLMKAINDLNITLKEAENMGICVDLVFNMKKQLSVRIPYDQ